MINIAWETIPAHCIFINIHTALPLQMVYHTDTQKNVIHHLTGFGKHSGYKVPGKKILFIFVSKFWIAEWKLLEWIPALQ